MSRLIDTLPDGTPARTDREYVRAWDEFTRKVCAALGPGWRRVAFDPGLTLVHEEHGRLDLTMWLAWRLIELHESRRIT